jgi:hypothetical protein
MRNQRLIVIGALIVVALVWLYFVMPVAPEPRAIARAAPAPVVAEKPPEPAPAPEPVAAPPHVEAPPPVAVAETPPAPDPEPEAPPAEGAKEVVPAADPDKAADLFADLLTKQDTESDENKLPNPARDLWKRFDKETQDADWAAAAAKHLQDTLEEWIDALPEEAGDHVVLVHVECRATLCQVLAADNDIAGQGARAEVSQEWQQVIAGLRNQSWWGESGFTDMTTQVTSSEGYVLYTTYLLRAAAPTTP